jgi:hypothetical protein
MEADFGTLVDFLRGELEPGEAATVRARLENEDALFQRFERLRRTYAVLRSMPAVGAGAAPAPLETENIPLMQPRAAFVRDVSNEFQTRGLASLIPHVKVTPQYLRALRVEFSVRAIRASLPKLVVGQSLLAPLRAEFTARARIDSLPFIKARPAWIAALRKEFVLRAVVTGIPLITPRPEFVAVLRAEFKQRALVASIPEMDVRAGFERRLKVALVEGSREVAAAAPVLPAVALPSVEASDPFRRRLFTKLLFSSRRSLREAPKRVDLAEMQWGRQMWRSVKDTRRSIGFTFAVHALAIVVLLFVFVRNDFASYNPIVAIGESEFAVLPALPDGSGDFTPGRTEPRVALPAAPREDWNPSGADSPAGLGGDELPDNVWRTQDESETPPPERRASQEETLALMSKENAASFFRLRGASREQKVDYLGSEELYEALDKSLAWLAKRQQLNPDNDGSWGYVNVDPRLVPRDPDLREVQQLEMTCAAVLAFLGDGHSSQKSPLPEYSLAVKRGVEWILSTQAADGQIGPARTGNVLVHAMGTLALAEEFGLTRRNDLREPLRKACRWLCEVRAEGKGGFPFLLGQPASMSTSVWAYMALATARNVQVPPIDLPQLRIDDFLEWYEDETGDSTRALNDAGPVLGHELLADSAAAAMCQFTLERDYQGRRTDLLGKIGRELPNVTPPGDMTRDNGDMRYLFFGSMANALNMQRTGRKSGEWYGAFAKTLLQNQRDDGAWAATSDYSSLYGDVYAVAMAGLSIENAYRVSILTK